jgi:two-component system sensor histidine kinase CssS
MIKNDKERFVMEKSNKTIKKRIFLSHISIVTVFMLLTLIIFSICFRLYIRRETRIQLIAASKLVQQSINADLKNNGTVIKSAVKINNSLKQLQSYSSISYALIDENKNILYPADDNNAEYTLMESQLLPKITYNRLQSSKPGNNAVFFITVQGSRYEAVICPTKLQNNSRYYIVIFSDISKSSSLTAAVFYMLLLILFITAVIALAISNNVSKIISKPISMLSTYAKKIGEREYNADPGKYDDSEMEQLAETMKAMAGKLSGYDSTIKTFLQNASHELRTPLMSIQGYAEGIKYKVVDDEEKAVNIIIEESKRISELVDDLLYLSKIDAMQDDLKFKKIDVEELLMNSIEKVSGVAIKNEKTICFTPEGKGLIVYADEEMLNRSLINLFGNCLRYAKKYVNVTLKKCESKINIIISDDGPGFDEKNLESIFNRFFKGKDGNHGLGLAITKSIIEKHRGTISAENGVNGGACFIITLV